MSYLVIMCLSFIQIGQLFIKYFAPKKTPLVNNYEIERSPGISVFEIFEMLKFPGL